MDSLLPAHANLDVVRGMVRQHQKTLLVLDYDGTLAPIVANPDEAEIHPANRAALERAVEEKRLRILIISGRSIETLRRFLGEALSSACGLIGAHGFAVELPWAPATSTPDALSHLPELERHKAALQWARARLVTELASIPGSSVESNGLAVSAHFRGCGSPHAIDAIKSIADRCVVARETQDAAGRPLLAAHLGKKVIELRPNVAWNKGASLVAIAQRLGYDDPSSLIIAVGDDITDEDMFCALNALPSGTGDAAAMDPEACSCSATPGSSIETKAVLKSTGLAVLVADPKDGPLEPPRVTRAHVHLRDCTEVACLIDTVVKGIRCR